jgi:hypothetical protein
MKIFNVKKFYFIEKFYIFGSFCYQASQQTTDEDEQRTIASEITEQSELNEPIDDPVNSNQMKDVHIYLKSEF